MHVCMYGCMYVWLYVCMVVCMYGCMYGYMVVYIVAQYEFLLKNMFRAMLADKQTRWDALKLEGALTRRAHACAWMYQDRPYC